MISQQEQGLAAVKQELQSVSQNFSDLQTAIVTITSLCAPHKQVVMVDSGADANLMDIDLAKGLGLEFVPLATPLVATALDGRLLWRVTHLTTQ
uniref:Uncharacterized protein n=1 Tax=Knipowitschia caucasica TaxID=637954 RepID=A0AAV2KQN4_KNICA